VCTEFPRRSRSARVLNLFTRWETRGGTQKCIEEFYDDSVKLGEGAYGTVTRRRARSVRALARDCPTPVSCKSSDTVSTACSESSLPEAYYAVKQIQWERIWRKRDQKLKQECLLRQELRTLIGLDHPNIAKMREWFEDPVRGIFFVIEFCEGGSFQEVLETDVCAASSREVRSAQMPRLRKIYRDLTYAVSYIHSRGVVHRDLKPENVMLKSRDPDSGAKLIDFGLAALKEAKGEGSEWSCGTMVFMAPELFLRTKGRFTDRSDMWSMGVILTWMASAVQSGTLRHPMLAEEDGAGFEVDWKDLWYAYRGQDPWFREIFTGLPEACAQLADSLLRHQPEERSTAATSLRNLWLAEHRPRSPSAFSFSFLKEGGAIRNMQTYSDLSQFDRAMLSLFAEHLNETQVRLLACAFRALDAEGCGQLSRDDLAGGLLKCGIQMSLEEVDELFRTVDSNGSGSIDYSEWLSATIGGHNMIGSEAVAGRVFSALDISRTGTVGAQELSRFIREDETQSDPFGLGEEQELALDRSQFLEVAKMIAAKRLSLQATAPAS